MFFPQLCISTIYNNEFTFPKKYFILQDNIHFYNCSIIGYYQLFMVGFRDSEHLINILVLL